jgi:hypothetical protein
MLRRLNAITIVIIAGCHPLAAQLYLVAGSPTPKYNSEFATVLLRVATEGNVQEIAELNKREEGSEWIAASDDWRKTVALAGTGQVTVVDFGEASISKRCRWPHQPGESLISQWLVESPISGRMFVELLAGDDVTKAYLKGMLLDSAVPCEESFVAVEPRDMKQIKVSGFAGLADAGSNDVVAQLAIDGEGRIGDWFPVGPVYLDYQIPMDLLRAIKQPRGMAIINNDHIFALSVSAPGDPSDDRLLVLRKRDNTWRPLPDFGGIAWRARGFGDFMTIAEARPRGVRLRESAGRAEWAAGDRRTGPNAAARFDSFSYVFPGKLHVYDVETERSYTITTDQGDSEILLIDDRVVYYRVSDRLYSVPIAGTGLGPAQLLATSDLVRDAHWAFRKR